MAIIPSRSEERAIERELSELRKTPGMTLRDDVPLTDRHAWDNALKIHRYAPLPEFFRWPPEYVRQRANLDEPLPFTLEP